MVNARRMREEDAGADLGLLQECFMLPASRVASYAATPTEDGWVVEDGGRIVAGLKAERLAQRYGGRAVSSAAIFGVKVAPECRGRGVGRALLGRMLEDLRTERVALATLYPTDARAYRAVGFELAGVHTRYTIRCDRLPFSRLQTERVCDPDPAELGEIYRWFAADDCGLLERSRRWWEARTLTPVGAERPQCFIVPGEKGPRGYLLLDRSDFGRLPSFDTHVRELVWHDASTLAALLSIAAANLAVSPTVTWPGPAIDPLLGEIEFPAVRVADCRLWMTRVLEPQRALAARGYPPGLAGRVTLQIEDELFAENEEPFDLLLADGGAVTQAPTGTPVRLSSQTLAALFTGWLDARVAARLGRLADATTDQIDLLRLALCGRPWLAEIF